MESLRIDRKLVKAAWIEKKLDMCAQLRKIRIEQGMQNKKLAMITGIRTYNLSQIELGHRYGMSWALIDFIARKLGYRLHVELRRDE